MVAFIKVKRKITKKPSLGMQIISGKYLIVDEESNAVDFLMRAYEFLMKVERNRAYLKWFIVAFHGALYSFMILALIKINSTQIYKDKNNNIHPMDRKILSFLAIYSLFKNKDKMGGNPFPSTSKHDRGIKELNNKLRNLMLHYRPMVWASESWYPARVCFPLLDILKFCINQIDFRHSSKVTLFEFTNNIQRLLDKYKKIETKR